MASNELKFLQLNDGWNAEPNAPTPIASRQGDDVLLEFYVNPWQYPAFSKLEKGILRFSSVSKFRLGGANDEGRYLGQCRYSKLAPAWGEFYEISGPDPLAHDGDDWQHVSTMKCEARHFLFYLRDETFEAFALGWQFESMPNNALTRLLPE